MKDEFHSDIFDLIPQFCGVKSINLFLRNRSHYPFISPFLLYIALIQNPIIVLSQTGGGEKMARKKLDYSYFNKMGKKVSGAAATLHEIYTVHGGLQNYHDYIGETYIASFVNAHSDIINAGIEATSKCNQFKVV